MLSLNWLYLQVLDRINGVAYVCLSDRADAALAQSWVGQLGYRVREGFTRQDSALVSVGCMAVTGCLPAPRCGKGGDKAVPGSMLHH